MIENLGKTNYNWKPDNLCPWYIFEFVFHISSNWVKIRLHTKNQLRRLPVTGGVIFVFLTLPIKSCFKLFCVFGWVVAISNNSIKFEDCIVATTSANPIPTTGNRNTVPTTGNTVASRLTGAKTSHKILCHSFDGSHFPNTVKVCFLLTFLK